MSAYYSENDPHAAAWIRNLIADGLVPAGDVDERPIVDVQPEDLAGYTACHFFAGVAGWAYAARLAGWPDERPLWTGSCPCQPFSVAGRGGGTADRRHLWPDFFRLIRACRPPLVMGEQVSGSAGYGWIDGVRSDLASAAYASRAVDIPSCAVDSPQIRSRLYWIAVGHSDGVREPQPEGLERDVGRRARDAVAGGVADAGCVELRQRRRRGPASRPTGGGGREAREQRLRDDAGAGDDGNGGDADGRVADAPGAGLPLRAGDARDSAAGGDREGAAAARADGSGGGYGDVAHPDAGRHGGVDGGPAEPDEDGGGRCVADATGECGPGQRQCGSGDGPRQLPHRGHDAVCGNNGNMADAAGQGWNGTEDAGANTGPERRGSPAEGGREAGFLQPQRLHGRNGTFWSDSVWLTCHDGRSRRAQPGIPLLVDGLRGVVAVSRPGATPEQAPETRRVRRTGAWRGFGNAINPILAAEVIGAFLDTEGEPS